ncbi:MAG: hypothetical protein A3K05_04915 [Candidatus Doudnabacteria bacterium RIFCSPHIGHO2_01_48_18]|nr:MAG: hypothetical protein A3K05_04915 [Candidatus Doudnabacteria bacterium RIFCSPHIGHO2_01_48_18]
MISAKKIHIVGISGAGVSALAVLLRQQGAVVSGSDLETGGHSAENVPADAELLIYSNAVPEDNAERAKAREMGIRQLSYPEALGEYSSGKKIIAVSGTNGKTTTTAMIAAILTEAGLDPTVLVGSKVLAWGSNARLGKSEYLVLEADEYRRAFLNYNPDIVVVTNIAPDHLDYYKDLEDIKTAFFQFTQKIKPGGVLVYNVEDESVSWVAQKYGGQAIGFAASTTNYKLRVPGKYNKANAQAAAAVAAVLGIGDETIKYALESFAGTWRRFERVGKFGETEIISDYAHHPDSVRGTLEAAAKIYDNKKVLMVFQPHQHNRTKNLFHEFVQAFCDSPVDDILLAEIFEVAGREETADRDVSSKDLQVAIAKCGKNARYAKSLADCEEQLRKIAKQYDAVIIMGAGDIYKVADKLVTSNK